MKIQRFLHSCILIEDAGTRILIDPGDYCFAEKLVQLKDLKEIDAILITHNHSDHCDIDAIKKINAKRIIGTASTAKTLNPAGITCEIVAPNEEIAVGSCNIKTITAPHDDRLTAPAPESIGYIINDTLLHPGDSLNFDTTKKFSVLALPIAAPWMVRREAIDLTKKIKPAGIIPIHDGMLKDFAAQATYTLFKKILEKEGITVHPLKLGESLEA